MSEEFQDKKCLECGFFCERIGQLDDDGNKIILCCPHKAQEKDPFSIESLPSFWCDECKDTVSREIEYRTTKLMKEDQ